ncbi:MAG: hypothetical protein R3325_16615 [Thermoanaerobaculia bacterium]|nr:hypothetical protein [Thermoanaerobaculia bacterium]
MRRRHPTVALATCATRPDWEVDDRPLVAALEAMGARVLEPNWDDPGFRWRQCDACLIRTTWDYESRRDEYVAWARRVAGQIPLFNSPEVVEWNTEKGYLRDLERRGVPIIPTLWLPRGASVDPAALLRERGWWSGFLKPLVGHSAQATLPFTADAEGLAAARAHLARHLPERAMMLQPYLDRVESEGEISAIFVDGELTHAVRKVPVPGDYRVQDDYGATDHPVTLAPAEAELARSIVAAAEADLLYARVDLLRDEAGELHLTELELVEPSLFFRHSAAAAERLAEALLTRVTRR